MYINRLKNGVGRQSDYIAPRDGIPLLFSREFALPDNQVPQSVKDGGVKLRFYPNTYVIDRRTDDGELVLKDICGHEVELPRTIAMFKPDKAPPEIIINGFGLFINKRAQEVLSEKDKVAVQQIISHFKKMREVDPQKSARHELRHYQNSQLFAAVHTADTALNDNDYLRTRFMDEISATIDDGISEKVHNREEGLQYVKEQFDCWMSNPDRQSYYAPHGDFQHQLGAYQNETKNRDTGKSAEMYKQIFKNFLTFKICGKEMDLSAAIAPDFKMPRAKLAIAAHYQGISR